MFKCSFNHIFFPPWLLMHFCVCSCFAYQLPREPGNKRLGKSCLKKVYETPKFAKIRKLLEVTKYYVLFK